jgi:hypothetical protein
MAEQFYTYMHTRNDTGKPFYIGKGRWNRAWDQRRARRGAHWSSIANKHGHTVHILAHWPTEREAFDHERFLIESFCSMGYSLANKTNGGEGASGHKWSQESRAMLSRSALARMQKIGNPMLGRKHSEETRAKQRDAKRGAFVGSNHPKASINEQTARSVLACKGRMTAREAAASLCVSWHVVRNIWAGKSWGFING